MTEWNSAHIAEDCYAVFIEAHEVFFQTDSFIADCIKSGRGWNGGEVVYLLDDVRSVRKDFFCDGATGGIDGVVYVHLSNNVFLRKVMVFTNNELNVQKVILLSSGIKLIVSSNAQRLGSSFRSPCSMSFSFSK